MDARRLAAATASILIAALSSGCRATTVDATTEVGHLPLCAAGVELGATSVSLSTQWRPDQKEPHDRERMARAAISNVFGDLHCGRFVGLLLPEAPGAIDAPEAAGADTRIAIVLREFGPELILSIPILWSLNTDVDYTLTVTDAHSGEVVLRVSERRKDGGPFVVQGIGRVGQTFEEALRALLYGAGFGDGAAAGSGGGDT